MAGYNSSNVKTLEDLLASLLLSASIARADTWSKGWR